jgi:hypothetical protein
VLVASFNGVERAAGKQARIVLDIKQLAFQFDKPLSIVVWPRCDCIAPDTSESSARLASTERALRQVGTSFVLQNLQTLASR